MPEDKDPFSEFGGTETKKSDSKDPFSEFGGSELKKKDSEVTGAPSSTGTLPISPSKSPSLKFDISDNAPAVQFGQQLKENVQQLKPKTPAMTSKETESIGKTLMAKVGTGLPAEPQPSPEKKQEENYQIEIGNIYEQARQTQNDIQVLQERGDAAGVQQLQAQYEQLHKQSQDLLKKYPKALEMINQQKYADDLYSGKTGAALEFGAQFGNAVLEGTKKLIEFAPRTAANITGNEQSAGQYAADAIDEFFNNRKFLVSTDQFQKADGDLNWSRIVPAIGQTAGTMLTLLGGGKAIGGSNASLFASSYMMTRNDYFDLAKQKGFTQAQSNAIADGSALLTSALELISPNPAIFTPEVKRQLLEEYAIQLAKSPKASFSNTLKTLATKEVIPENIQELAQNMGDKIVQAGADYITGTDKFDPQLLDKNEIMSTVALTTLTTGLISGTGVIAQNKAARAQAIYELSKDLPRTTQVLEQQVNDGTITEQDAKAVMNVVQKGAEAAAKVPDTITEDKKADATELVAEKTAIEQSIEGKDEALITPQKQRIEEINNELTRIATEPAKETKPEDSLQPEIPKETKISEPAISENEEKVKQALSNVENTTKVLSGIDLDKLKEKISNTYKVKHKISSPITTSDRLEDGGSGFEWKHVAEYFDLSEKSTKQSYRVLNSIRNKPDAEIMVYRAVPIDVKEINQGDWVTLSKEYAESETEDANTPNVISKKIKASELGWDGNDLNEFAYFPTNEKAIAESYHAAKKYGNNPELVKAVEDSIKQQINEQETSESSTGVQQRQREGEVKEDNGKVEAERREKGRQDVLTSPQEDTGGEKPPVVESKKQPDETATTKTGESDITPSDKAAAGQPIQEEQPVEQLTTEEKDNLQKIEQETGDNFRLVQNVYAKYGEGKPLSEITAEDYQKAKEKRDKIKKELELSEGKKIRRMAEKFIEKGYQVPKSLAEYTPVTEADYETQAAKIIDELGVEEATAFLLNNAKTIDERLLPVLGGQLMDKVNRLADQAEKEGDTDSQEIFSSIAYQIMDTVLPQGTRHAQALRMFAAFYKGNPFMHIKEVQAAIDKANQGKKEAVKKLVEELNNQNKEAVAEVVKNLFGDTKGVQSKAAKRLSNRFQLTEEDKLAKETGTKKFGPGTFNDVTRIATLLADKDFRKYAKVILKESALDATVFAEKVVDAMGEKARAFVGQIYKAAKQEFDTDLQADIQKQIKFTMKELGLKLSDLVKNHYETIADTEQTLAKKIVDELGLPESEAAEIEKSVREEFKKLTAKAKISAAKRSGLDIWTEVVAMSDTGLLDSADVLAQLGKKLGIIEITPAIKETLVKLAKEITNIPEASITERGRAIQALVDYKYKVSKKLGFFDFVVSNFLTNIFGSIGANEINSAGNELETISIFSGALGKAIVKGDLSDAKLLIDAFIKGHKYGLKTTKEILATGINPRKDIGNITPRNVFELIGVGEPDLMSSVERLWVAGLKGSLNIGIPFTGLQIRTDKAFKAALAERKFWGRLLGAMDGLAGTTNMEIASVMTAMKEADKRGLKGNERAKFLRELVYGDTVEIGKAVEYAKSKGVDTTTKKGRKKFNELIFDHVISSRPEWLTEPAKQIARRATLTQTPPDSTIVGNIANKVSRYAGKRPAVKFIFPAVNAIANYFIKQVERTPIGFGSIMTDLVMDKQFRTPSEKITPEEYQRRFKAALVGTVIGAILFNLAGGFDDEEKCFEIFGSGSGDRDLDAQRMSTGWKPHSIRFTCDGGYYDYSYWPIAFLLSMVGDMRDYSKYDVGTIEKLKDKISQKLYKKPYDSLSQDELSGVAVELNSGRYDLEGAQTRDFNMYASQAMTAPAKMFLDYGFMQGAKNILDVATEKKTNVSEKIKKTVVGTTKGLLIPSYIAETRYSTDPKIYESKTYFQSIANYIPFVQIGNTRLDAFGRDITRYDNENPLSGLKYGLTRRLYSPSRGTPLDGFLIKNNVSVSNPDNRDMMNEEDFRRFVVRQGSASLIALNTLLDSGSFEGKSPNEIAELSSDVIAKIRKREKAIVLIEQKLGHVMDEDEYKKLVKDGEWSYKMKDLFPQEPTKQDENTGEALDKLGL